MKNLFKIVSFILIIVGFNQAIAMQPHKAKERLELIKKMKMLEILELDEAKGEKFLLKYNAAENKIEDIQEEMRDISEDLKKAIDDEEKEKYVALTDKLIAKQDEMFKAQKEKINSVKSILTEEEFAKFVLFENHFPHMIRKFLSEPRMREGREMRRDRR